MTIERQSRSQTAKTNEQETADLENLTSDYLHGRITLDEFNIMSREIEKKMRLKPKLIGALIERGFIKLR